MPLIIWDWNGTLLNDMGACIDAINVMLEKRGVKTIDFDTYRDMFTFPVIEYYRALGFDFDRENFGEVSGEFIGLYTETARHCPLQPGSSEVIMAFKKRNYEQIIISAMERRLLVKQVAERGLKEYFTDIVGLENIRAKGKYNSARECLNRRNAGDNEKILWIGDTFHDYEVAMELGIKCLLVKNGHQNLDRFHLNGDVRLLTDLDELKEYRV
ncbi:MAG: HAD family hydrolase [Spirochaetales bacterium]|nr:HAD family hydrolase [Spirochaetales bacterium]